MKLKVFTIHDSKAEAYLQPFQMNTKGEALRAITELANDPNHNFGKYSADYTLFDIGEYDNITGMYHQHKQHINLGNLLEFKAQQNKQ